MSRNLALTVLYGPEYGLDCLIWARIWACMSYVCLDFLTWGLVAGRLGFAEAVQVAVPEESMPQVHRLVI